MLKKLLLAIATGTMIMVLTNCKSDSKEPEPSVEEMQLAKLVTTWKCSSAVLDGVAKDGYSDFRLTIASASYTTTGRPMLSAWPASGTWKFGTDPMKDIFRDPELVTAVVASYVVTDTQLTITFTYTGDGFTARKMEIDGTWVFTFTK